MSNQRDHGAQCAQGDAEPVFLTAWALVLQAIRSRGTDEALRILDALNEGRAHVSMHFELSAGSCRIVASLCQDGQLDPLLIAGADALQGRPSAH